MTSVSPAQGVLSGTIRKPGPGPVALGLYRKSDTFRWMVDIAALGTVILTCVILSGSAPALIASAPTRPAAQKPIADRSGVLAELLKAGMGQQGPAAPRPADYELGPRAFLAAPPDIQAKLALSAERFNKQEPSAAIAEPLQGLDPARPEVMLMQGLATLRIGGGANAIAGLKLIEQSAAAGYTPAMSMMGIAAINPPAGRAPDSAEARRWLQQAADAGDGQAVALLARAYETGWAGVTDPARAAALYRRAHDLGNGRGSMGLSAMLIRGVGVKADDAEAERIVRLCAERGDVNCQVATGVFLATAAQRGWESSFDESLMVLHKAADQGHPVAMEWIGGIKSYLDTGAGHDPVEGLKWFERCAKLGSMMCQHAAAEANRKGLGTSVDLPRARAFYLLAKEHGAKGANKKLAELKLTPAEIVKSHAILAELHQTHRFGPPVDVITTTFADVKPSK